jgi:hypothetical protein
MVKPLLFAGAALVPCLIAVGCGERQPTAIDTTARGLDPRAEAAHVRPLRAPAAGGWNMDVKTLRYPDSPAAGKINGADFKPDRVELEDFILTFRQGGDFFPDREIKLFLNAGQEGLGAKDVTLEVAARGADGAAAPHVHLAVKGPGDMIPTTQMFLDKYALRLELGKFAAGKLPGRIYLCLPDKGQSYLAGSFTAAAPGLGGAKITGRIALQKPGSFIVSAGYVGSTMAGKLKSGMAGAGISPQTSVQVTSSGSHLAYDPDKGCSFKHVGLPPGDYLVFVTWDEHHFDGRWVEVKEGADGAVDLALEPAGEGAVEVQLPAAADARKVYLVPLAADGKLPAPAAPLNSLAFQLGVFVKCLTAEVPVKQDRVTLAGLRAGPYRALAGKATTDVTVKAGMTVKAVFP